MIFDILHKIIEWRIFYKRLRAHIEMKFDEMFVKWRKEWCGKQRQDKETFGEVTTRIISGSNVTREQKDAVIQHSYSLIDGFEEKGKSIANMVAARAQYEKDMREFMKEPPMDYTFDQMLNDFQRNERVNNTQSTTKTTTPPLITAHPAGDCSSKTTQGSNETIANKFLDLFEKSQKELNDTKQQLKDNEHQLTEAQHQLENKEQQLTEAQQQLTGAQQQLENKEQKLLFRTGQKRKLEKELNGEKKKRKDLYQCFVQVNNMHKTACQDYDKLAQEKQRQFDAFEREIGKKD